MVRLATVLSQLNRAKVLVVGDLLLDMYTIGQAERISPEAPVPVIKVKEERQSPGGAGNVMLNLHSLGAEVIALGRIGQDWAGESLLDCLCSEGIQTSAIVIQQKYKTPVKNRILANYQQIVRIDHEQVTKLSDDLEEQIIASLPKLLVGVKVVAISDYGKGFCSRRLLCTLINHANLLNIPVITDPKGIDFTLYQGTTLIKPNLSEAYAAAKLSLTASLDEVADQVIEKSNCQYLMITRSEAGISLFDRARFREDFPVAMKEVLKDVTGAGDTVLAMLAFAIANQLTYSQAAELCNVAAGIAIEQIGCYRVTLADLARRLFELDHLHKIFDQQNLFILKEILRNQPYNLLVLSETESLTPALFQTIKKMANPEKRLIIWMEQEESPELFIEMLSSLNEVAYVIKDPLGYEKSECFIPNQICFFDTAKEREIAHGCRFSMEVPSSC
jgi:D-glycero-beta-D-manno-heptose-7-phosphate kinase